MAQKECTRCSLVTCQSHETVIGRVVSSRTNGTRPTRIVTDIEDCPVHTGAMEQATLIKALGWSYLLAQEPASPSPFPTESE